MGDPRFFSRAGPFTLGALAELSRAKLLRPDEGGRLLYDVSPLETAGPEEVSFLENRKYVEAFVQSAAGPARDGADPQQYAVQSVCPDCPRILPRTSCHSRSGIIGADRSSGPGSGR